MTTPDPHDQPSPVISGLTVDDAIELAEILTFIDNWCPLPVDLSFCQRSETSAGFCH